MELILRRFAYKNDYTIGRLCVAVPAEGDVTGGGNGNDGAARERYVCDTLEPRSSHTSSSMPEAVIKMAKRSGVTAIPRGRYRVTMAYSRKFCRYLPLLVDVRCYEGVFIHPGNYPRETRGCILPGWNRRRGMVCGSRSAMAEILSLMNAAIGNGETVTLTVREENCVVPPS